MRWCDHIQRGSLLSTMCSMELIKFFHFYIFLTGNAGVQCGFFLRVSVQFSSSNSIAFVFLAKSFFFIQHRKVCISKVITLCNCHMSIFTHLQYLQPVVRNRRCAHSLILVCIYFHIGDRIKISLCAPGTQLKMTFMTSKRFAF